MSLVMTLFLRTPPKLPPKEQILGEHDMVSQLEQPCMRNYHFNPFYTISSHGVVVTSAGEKVEQMGREARAILSCNMLQ